MKTAEKNKPFLTLSGKSATGWGGLIVSSFILIFFIGTLVGRGSITVDLGQHKLSNEIGKYEQSLNNLNNENIEIIDDAPDLVFYETLQKKELPKVVATNKTTPSPQRKMKKVIKKTTAIHKPAQTVKETVIAKTEPSKKNADVYKYSIQVASFKGIDDAKKTVTRYKQSGYSAYYVKAVVRTSEVWYRVRIGTFKDRRDAKKTLLRLEKNNIDGFLVTR